MNQAIKIFTSVQIKKADEYTVAHEPIASIDLMERAATKCTQWLIQNIKKKDSLLFFCGPGNNGGDGLVIARQLHILGYTVKVYLLSLSKNCSVDFSINEERLRKVQKDILHTITSSNEFPEINKTDIIIDAIFGTGLNKTVSGLAGDCISLINKSGAKVIAIDMPSGLFTDAHTDSNSTVIKATHTLSFQFPKLAFFFPENASFVGDWQILNIGISETFISKEVSKKYFITKDCIKTILKPRKKYSHKGTFGHTLIVAGSYGKMGAAVLSANACLRSGAGLLTAHVPKSGYEIIQITSPEAMVSIDQNENLFSDKLNTSAYTSIAVGPGIGTEKLTQDALKHLLLNSDKPLVIDADALNNISLNDWSKLIPLNSILTPHPKEFERLTKKAKNDFERHTLQIEYSVKYNVYVILKGAHTCITTPNGDCYFNSTGNPGMAKGGSGDILTGIIAGLMAQGYTSIESCILGVFIHGLAGDIAKKEIGEIGMASSDITTYLPIAFKVLTK